MLMEQNRLIIQMHYALFAWVYYSNPTFNMFLSVPRPCALSNSTLLGKQHWMIFFNFQADVRKDKKKISFFIFFSRLVNFHIFLFNGICWWLDIGMESRGCSSFNGQAEGASEPPLEDFYTSCFLTCGMPDDGREK